MPSLRYFSHVGVLVMYPYSCWDCQKLAAEQLLGKAGGTVRLGRRYGPMRPKARELAQHGGPSGWLEEIDPAGVMDAPYLPAFPYRTGCPDRSCPAAN